MDIMVPSAEAIVQEWKSDSKVDDVNLDSEALRIPNLHSKYVGILSDARRESNALQRNRRRLANILRSYYTGRASSSELQILERSPYPLRIMKSEIDRIVEADEKMIQLDSDLDNAIELVELLQEIVRGIRDRGYQIRNAIEWKKFMGGV